MNYAFCFVRRTFAAVLSQTERETRLCRRTDRVPNTPRENYVLKMESTYFGRFIPVSRSLPCTGHGLFFWFFFFTAVWRPRNRPFSPPRKTTNRQRLIRSADGIVGGPSLSTPATDLCRRFFRSETAFDFTKGKKKSGRWNPAHLFERRVAL